MKIYYAYIFSFKLQLLQDMLSNRDKIYNIDLITAQYSNLNETREFIKLFNLKSMHLFIYIYILNI